MRKVLIGVLCLSTALSTALVVLSKRDAFVAEPHAPVVPPDPAPVAPVEPVIPEVSYDDALKSITKDELTTDLHYLASPELEGRMSGKKGNVVAAEFLKKQFEEAGLPTMYDKFSIKRMNPGPKNEVGDDFTQNIYAWIEGTDLKDEIVVIGAHMDHIGYGPGMSRAREVAIHPGADDNASGTVALVEIAEAFAALKPKVRRTVVFQAYSAEEMGLIGSRHYCDEPKFPIGAPDIKKHVFMLNMDMIGWLHGGSYFAGFVEGNSSPNLRHMIGELNGSYDFAERITSHGTGGSDHACFYNKKVPIAFLHTGLHAHYHKPSDTADKINYDGLEQVARYAFELAWKVTNEESSPRFDVVSYVPMSYEHDHGHSDEEVDAPTFGR